MLALLRVILMRLKSARRFRDQAWLIDRDGRVYKPSRRVVLRARG